MKDSLYVWGYFGKGNLGDDLIMQSIEDVFRHFEIDLRFLWNGFRTIDYKGKNFTVFTSFWVERDF